MNHENIDEIGFVKLSEQRKKVVMDISDKLKIPTEISKSTGLSISEVSRSLKMLKDKGIVVCLNEKQKMGRVYSLTEKGLEILKYIE